MAQIQHSENSARGIRRLLNESQIQPELKSNMTCCEKLLNIVDIFSFIPTPQTYKVSTKKSKIGSIILILLFLTYMIYDFVTFLINNTPKLNSYELPLPTQNYTVPQMAIGFIYGPNLNTTINDPTLFNISLFQAVTTQGKPVTNNATLYPCGVLDWLGPTQQFYQNLSCINPDQLILQGLLYASTITYNPRLQVALCNYSDVAAGCSFTSTDGFAALYNITAGGRLFLFIQRQQNNNFATIKGNKPNEFGTFTFYNYFLVPFLYNRVIITLQPTQYIIYPDYITSFTKSYINEMVIVDQQMQVSNVSNFNSLDLFSINVILSSQVRVNEVVYSTLIDHVSMWGAFWGVLFAAFAIVFLAYNRKKFYESKPDWQNFEEKVNQIQNQLKKEYDQKVLQLSKYEQSQRDKVI